MSDLPPNWCDTKFTEVFDVQGGTQPPKSTFIDNPADGYVRLLQIRDFGSKPVPTYIPITKSIKTCRRYDLLIARYGASLGRICTGMEGAYNVALAKLICPEEIQKSFAKYYLRSEQFQSPLRLLSRSAQNGFNKEDLSDFGLSLPPLAEQARIAAKLDELLAQVDTLKARIDGIPALLKRFRQSVLAAAVSGRLTEEWRASAAVDWSFQRAADVCEKVQSGGTPKEGFSESGVPFLKVYNIVNQEISFEYRPQYISESIHRGASSKSITMPGDVVMNIVGPPLGKIATIPTTSPEWNINQAITLFRPSENIISGWISIVLLGGENLRSIINETKGSAGQVNISLSQCRGFLFPVPCVEEQTEIVRRVEQLFAFADQLESRVKAAQARIDHLTQSILAKAFRGELVPQDPNDEPASVLLERIKAQRAAAPKAKRGKKTGT
ncbi:restriction endonuclease subunit S [Pseudomonas sp. NPDC077408]